MQIKRESLAFVLIVSMIITCSAAGAVQVFSTTVPICFIQNDGQTDGQVLYFADAAGYTLYLTAEGEVISTADPVSVVEITYPGSTAAIAVSGENILPGKANFLIGNDEDQWVTNVPLYGSVRYAGLYEGVSLVYHGGVSTLKKEFIVEPGADPLGIRMQYTGQEGLALDKSGALLVTTAAGTFFETPPVCYQVVGGAEVAVPCRFVLDEEGVVTFSVGAYDRTLPLVIDPQYDFSTYLGGTQDDWGAGIGFDDIGNVYVVGSTESTQFPLANNPAYQEHLNGSGLDIFASKFRSDGQELIYSTYIGGYADDIAGGMVVNNYTGIVTFTGSTKSWNYPTNPTDPYGGNTDAIVTRLNVNGDALVWSRMIYGNKTDVGTAIAIDDPVLYDEVVVVGYTTSDNLTTGWLFTNGPVGGTDAFVLKLWNNGVSYAGRYLGGNKNDYAYGVAVQQGAASGNPDIWVTGSTESLNFPTPGPAFRHTITGESDAFITRFNWDLSDDVSTYLGGSKNDAGTAIAIDSNLCPYITGYTESPVSPISLFPIKPLNQAFQKTFNGGQWDAFVTKMESNLSVINYSTYLGGLYDEKAYGIRVDNLGTAYVTGYTNSENFPLQCHIQPVKGLGYYVPDAFITQLNQTGTGLLFSTYLGGTYFDEGKAIAISPDGLNISVTGYTESINFPLQDPYQPYLSGFCATRFKDAFVTKIVKIPPVANINATPLKGCSPVNISFKDNSTNNPIAWLWEFGDNTPNSTLQNPIHRYYNNCSPPSPCPGLNYTVNLTVWNCDGSNTTSRNVTICPNLWYNFTSDNAGDPLPRGCVGANATFIFSGVQQSGGPLFPPYWWFDFGDNTTGSYPVPGNNHTFTNTSNYTVTFWVQNECCNNSSTMIVDMRETPVADFYANPLSGLIPLTVNFFDNSSGRPDNWTWSYRNDTVWNKFATTKNTTFPFSSKGAYDIKLKACNFCGCNETKPKNNYIKAGVPNLSFKAGRTMVLPNGTIIVPTNDTTPLGLYLQEAPDGLSGFDLNVSWGDSVHGDIKSVLFPAWASNTSTSTLPYYLTQVRALDLGDDVKPGEMNILLCTFDLKGTNSTFTSTIDFNVDPLELDSDYPPGSPIDTNNVPATIMVVRLLPFPNKIKAPKDPDGDQLYYDVNGNGCIDFSDVTIYFQNMQWIRANQYNPFFDYNKNGYIDFNDVILLFHKVGPCP